MALGSLLCEPVAMRFSPLVAAGTLALTLIAVVSVNAQQWPSFRGPMAAGTLDRGAVPTTWNVARGEGVRWRTPIPGLSHASPIVWNDRVYVVSAVRLEGASALDRRAEGVVFASDTVRHAFRLYALDRATGRIVWERTAREGAPQQGRHVRGTYANATPATDGQAIVASLGYEGVFCFNLDGTLRWRVPGLADHTQMYDPASSPVIHDGLVIVQHDWKQASHLAAYDIRDGREVWRQAQPFDRIPTPFAAGDLTIIAGGGGERPIFAVRPTAAGDITPAAGGPTPGGVAWTTERGSPYMSTPVAAGGLLYVIAQNGVLSVFDLADGRRVYQQRIGQTGSAYSASPVAAGGHVFLTSEDGDVTVVRLGRAFEPVSVNSLGDVAFATPALVAGGLIFRTAGYVVAIGAGR
jgi:outer membrane protein assembly factor BamB